MNLERHSIEAFNYTALPVRVLFEFGTMAKAADEFFALGGKRAFVVSDLHHMSGAAARLIRVSRKI
jgi:hypothetical protein